MTNAEETGQNMLNENILKGCDYLFKKEGLTVEGKTDEEMEEIDENLREYVTQNLVTHAAAYVRKLTDADFDLVNWRRIDDIIRDAQIADIEEDHFIHKVDLKIRGHRIIQQIKASTDFTQEQKDAMIQKCVDGMKFAGVY
jgi:hypothetical protein